MLPLSEEPSLSRCDGLVKLWGPHALVRACSYHPMPQDDPDLVYELYQRGYSVNGSLADAAADDDGNETTPVQLAIRASKWQMLNALLNLGADPYGGGGEHEPLVVAYYTGHIQCALILLDRGVRIRHNTLGVRTPYWAPIFLHTRTQTRAAAVATWCAAKRLGHPLLVCNRLARYVWQSRWALLAWCSAQLPDALIAELVDMAVAQWDRTAISHLCSRDFEFDLPQMLYVLVRERGHDVNRWRGIDNPLKLAVGCNKPWMVDALLDLGAEPNFHTPRCMEPLLLAYKEDYRECAKLMLDWGVRPVTAAVPTPTWVTRDFLPARQRARRAALTLGGLLRRRRADMCADMRRKLVLCVWETRMQRAWERAEEEETDKSWCTVL